MPAGPLVDPAYFYTPAAVVLGFLFLAIYGWSVKGRDAWKLKKKTLLPDETVQQSDVTVQRS